MVDMLLHMLQCFLLLCCVCWCWSNTVWLTSLLCGCRCWSDSVWLTSLLCVQVLIWFCVIDFTAVCAAVDLTLCDWLYRCVCVLCAGVDLILCDWLYRCVCVLCAGVDLILCDWLHHCVCVVCRCWSDTMWLTSLLHVCCVQVLIWYSVIDFTTVCVLCVQVLIWYCVTDFTAVCVLCLQVLIWYYVIDFTAVCVLCVQVHHAGLQWVTQTVQRSLVQLPELQSLQVLLTVPLQVPPV